MSTAGDTTGYNLKTKKKNIDDSWIYWIVPFEILDSEKSFCKWIWRLNSSSMRWFMIFLVSITHHQGPAIFRKIGWHFKRKNSFFPLKHAISFTTRFPGYQIFLMCKLFSLMMAVSFYIVFYPNAITKRKKKLNRLLWQCALCTVHGTS